MVKHYSNNNKAIVSLRGPELGIFGYPMQRIHVHSNALEMKVTTPLITIHCIAYIIFRVPKATYINCIASNTYPLQTMFRGDTYIFGVTHLVGNKSGPHYRRLLVECYNAKVFMKLILGTANFNDYATLRRRDQISRKRSSFFFMPLSDVMTLSTHYVHVDGTCML